MPTTLKDFPLRGNFGELSNCARVRVCFRMRDSYAPRAIRIMTTKIFSIANQKGGVGKTTTAVNLSCGLARRGVPVLLVDLDSQANATSALGVEKKVGGSLYGTFFGEASAQDKIIPTGTKNLDLIPSEADIAAIESELLQLRKDDYLGALRDVLKPVKDSGKYAAIILDCPPSLGMLSMNSLVAADFLLITLQCEYLAMEGLSQILETVERIRDSGNNPELSIGGILMTMFDVRTNLSRAIVEDVAKTFPQLVFKSRIPRSVRLGEAPSYGKSIFDYDPNGSGALAYDALAKECVRRFSLKG